MSICVLVAYYSTTGTRRRLAEAVTEGAEKESDLDGGDQLGQIVHASLQ